VLVNKFKLTSGWTPKGRGIKIRLGSTFFLAVAIATSHNRWFLECPTPAAVDVLVWDGGGARISFRHANARPKSLYINTLVLK
jgi:hypothetical protein